jgi:hypothetical protein
MTAGMFVEVMSKPMPWTPISVRKFKVVEIACKPSKDGNRKYRDAPTVISFP